MTKFQRSTSGQQFSSPLNNFEYDDYHSEDQQQAFDIQFDYQHDKYFNGNQEDSLHYYPKTSETIPGQYLENYGNNVQPTLRKFPFATETLRTRNIELPFLSSKSEQTKHLQPQSGFPRTELSEIPLLSVKSKILFFITDASSSYKLLIDTIAGLSIFKIETC